MNYDTTYTRGPFDNSAAPTVGGELAAFLLGVPAGELDRTASYAQQDKWFGIFLHDDWKVGAKLTLNLGLRYEYEWPVTERFNRSVAHFAFDQPSPIAAQAQANYARSPIPELPPSQFKVNGGLTFAGTPATLKNRQSVPCAMIFCGLVLDHRCFMHAQGVKAQRVLWIVLAPLAVRDFFESA